MLNRVEHFIRQLSWIPGLRWLDTWANSMYSQAGQYDQIKGDMELQAQEMAKVASDPLGTKAYGDGEGDVEGDADTDGAQTTKSNGKSKPVAAAADSNATASPGASSGVPPKYRTQRSAMRASCLMFVFLVVLVAVVWTIFWLDPRNVPWRHSMSWWRIAAQVVLVFTIPIVLFRIIRAWLEGAPSHYPDLQYAWDYGLQACQVAGVNIDQVPLYLLLGSENERQEMAIHHAADLEYRAAGLPHGPAALHWYVAPDAIYLYATEVGWLSCLAAPLGENELDLDAENPNLAISDGITQVEVDDALNPHADKQPVGEGTVMADRWEAESGFQIDGGRAQIAGQATSNEQNFEHTLTADTASNSGPLSTSVATRRRSGSRARSLNSVQSAKELTRLRFLSRLIRNVRSPLCPINGIVVLIPHHLVDGSNETMDETEKAISSDLSVIEKTMQLRSPVTVLITGMEKERGFCELIRRVGPTKAKWQRFGKRYDVATRRTESDLKAFNVHLTGAFEDWIYTLFREQDALTRPGNTGLYELLGNIRCSWKARTEKLLTRVFADESNQPMFSGCYFAATGSTSDRQAFVRAVFEKLGDEQELLQWTSSAQREDRRIRVLAILGYAVTVLGLLAILYRVGQLWRWW